MDPYHLNRPFPIEIQNHIFSYLEGDSMMSIRSVSQFFNRTIKEVIYNSTRDDVFRYLFRIQNLSQSTLRSFISEMIQVIIKFEPKIQYVRPNWVLERRLHCLSKNMFFKQLSPFDAKIIDFPKYCQIWIPTILAADRMDLIYDMYPHVSIHKYKWGIQINIPYQGCEMVECAPGDKYGFFASFDKHFGSFDKHFAVPIRDEDDKAQNNLNRMEYYFDILAMAAIYIIYCCMIISIFFMQSYQAGYE
jgi:hypothetical protein